MKGITPFLWFNDNAQEAVDFYVSVFPNSRVTGTSRYGETGPGPKGSVMTVAFELDGTRFTALNGGPNFKFTEAVSFVVHCDTQEEVDRYWAKLSEGGATNVCGWLKDKYGLSWQIVPVYVMQVLEEGNPRKTEAMMREIVKMTKLDIAPLKRAYEAA
jgi:predicted 3-demethylubiquinone-9 3-methyltransferase (glyoxalase superfamily)